MRMLRHRPAQGPAEMVRVGRLGASTFPRSGAAPAEAPAASPRVWDISGLGSAPLRPLEGILDVDLAVVCASAGAAPWAEEWAQAVQRSLSSLRMSIGVVVVVDGPESDTEGWRRALGQTPMPHLIVPLARNVGPAAARNMGMLHLGDRCQYVIFLDADDLLCPAMAKLVGRATQADITWGRINYLREGELCGEHLPYREEALKSAARARVMLDEMQCDPIPLLGTVVRLSAVRQVGGFNGALGHSADWDLWLRMLDNGARLAPCRVGPVATYRVHGAQIHKQWTFAAYQGHVPAIRRARQEVAVLRGRLSEQPSLACYQNNWTTGGAQQVILDLARQLWPWWQLSSIERRREPTRDQTMANAFGSMGLLYACPGGEALTEALNRHTARFTYLGDALPPGVRTTHVHYGGDSLWNRTVPPSHVRGIYCSEFLRGYLEQQRGARDPRGVVIPNAVDVRALGQVVGRAAVRERLAIEPEAFVYLWAGRIVGVKQPAAFARAAQLVARGCYPAPVYFVVAGPAYTTSFAEELWAAAAPLGSRFRYVGEVEPRQLPLLYHAADAFVSTSLFEGLGLTVLEAMAAGLPVIAVDNGGVRETIVDGRTGRIVPAGYDALLAEQMMALYFNREQAVAMGRAGRRRAGLFDLAPWAVRHEIEFLREASDA